MPKGDTAVVRLVRFQPGTFALLAKGVHDVSQSYDARKMEEIARQKRLERPIVKKFFTPVGDRVAVQVVQTQETTLGGVVLPEASQGEWFTPVALVIACGPDCKQIKEGDLVLLRLEQQMVKIRRGKDEVLMCREFDYLGVVDDATRQRIKAGDSRFEEVGPAASAQVGQVKDNGEKPFKPVEMEAHDLID
jgi:co-chaperonin GroES (HSP10)